VAHPVTEIEHCERCHGDRIVFSEVLHRRIRCPRCTKPRPSRHAMRELTEHERRHRAAQEQHARENPPVKPMSGLAWTVGKLYQWGKMVRDRGIGYPPMAATENARIGRGGVELMEIPFPPDLAAIDRAVSGAPSDYKAILVEHYTKHGTVQEKAAHLSISRQTYYDRKEKAEQYIANTIGV
jgi:hypothetical protein